MFRKLLIKIRSNKSGDFGLTPLVYSFWISRDSLARFPYKDASNESFGKLWIHACVPEHNENSLTEFRISKATSATAFVQTDRRCM